MDTKIKATANLYDLNFLINNSMHCRRFGQQVGKISISQFGGNPFKHICKLCSKREKIDKNYNISMKLEP